MKIRYIVLFIMLWLLSSSAFSSSASDSDYRMVLLDYNSERCNETISFIEMAKNGGVFTLKGESKSFFTGFYRYYDRYMRYLDAKGNLVSISSIDGNTRKDNDSDDDSVGFSPSGRQNRILFINTGKGSIHSVKAPVAPPINRDRLGSSLTLPYCRYYASENSDLFYIYSAGIGNFSFFKGNIDILKSEQIKDMEWLTNGEANGLLAADKSYTPFNISDKGEKVCCSALSPYTQLLFTNYCSFLNGKGYSKEYLQQFRNIFIRRNAENPEILKMMGWQIFVSERKMNSDGEPELINPVRIISNYPIYSVEKRKNRYITQIPHKCWSPDGSKILFVGSLEEPFSANVYCVDLKDNRITTVLNSQDKTGTFNPDLEWTEKGIVITCRDSIYYGSAPENIRRLEFKDKVKNICQGRMNRDGNAIVFAAEKDKRSCLLVFDIETGTLNELKILKNKPENYQFAWVKQNEKTVIRNEADSCILSDSLWQYEIIGHLFSDSYYSFYDTACAAGRNDLAMLIIKLSGNINSVDLYKRTFLASAVRFNNNDITDFLLKSGADVNSSDTAGWTPLHYAAENHNCSAMEKLIACGAKLNCRSGKIQFTINIFRGTVASCIYERVPAEIPASEKSVIYKSNNNFTDSGLTPLHLLCFFEKYPRSFSFISSLDGKSEQDPRLNCIRYLLGKGVDINQTTDSGKTPLDYAIYSGDIKTVEFLKANGAVSHKNLPFSVNGKPARTSGGMNPAGGILVMKYDKARQTEDCSCYQVGEKLNLLKTTQLKGISETDRNLRYLRHGKLFCLETINHTNNNRLEIYLCLKNLKTDKTQKYLFFSVFTTGKNSGNNDYDISDQIPGAFLTPENEVVVITHPFYCKTCGNMLLINAKKTRSYDKDFIGNRGKDIDLSAILNSKMKPSETGNNIKKMEPIIGYPLNPVFSPDGSVVSYGFYKDSSFKTNIVFCRRSIIAGDVVNWQNILIILKNPEINRNIPIIRKYLNKNTRIFLRDYTVGKQVTDSVKADIINGLNKCIDNDHDLFERVSIGCLNRLPVDGKEYPNGAYYAINGRTMNRLFLEKIFGNSLKRSSVPEIIASSFPVYRQEGNFIKIPHKCWSPAGDKILLTGALEKEYCANVYTIDINSRKIEKVLDVDDSSGNFNPDLEWNENGMAITCKDGIFVMNVKAVESSTGKLVKLPIPQNISDLKNGRISPDGNQLFFFGKKDGNVNLFVYNFADSSMINEIIGNDPDMENYQGTWIYKDRMSIIKNEMDYIKPEKMR